MVLSGGEVIRKILSIVFLFSSLFWIPFAFGFSTSSGEKAAIAMPLELARVVQDHLLRMEQGQNFFEVSSSDLFHGHFIYSHVENSPIPLRGVEKLLVGISYHTDENGKRWKMEKKSGIPAGDRVQRSVIGFLDGTIRPSIDFIQLTDLKPARQRGFRRWGTVFTDDLVRANPEWSELGWRASSAKKTQKVAIKYKGRKSLFFLQDQFLIEPVRDGRFKTLRGVSYEIYLVISNRENPIRYGVERKFPEVISPDGG